MSAILAVLATAVIAVAPNHRHHATHHKHIPSASWGHKHHWHPPAPPWEEWTIPPAIVMCESKGTNEAPNSASASGYYQIIVSTWDAFGGQAFASEAWLASKHEQGIVARRIWNSGGPEQWVCKA